MLVLGLGETGLATAQWLAGRGARLRVADSREKPPGLGKLRAAVPTAELHLGHWQDASFRGIDLIVISPGVPRETPQVQRALAAGIPVVGDVELFAQALTALNRPHIIAITGTNGKSTVTALTGALCRAAGLDAEVAGNISPAVLHALAAREKGGKAAGAWVLELSSFQLESTASLNASAATMLNLSEDHLDRYPGLREYAAAKARIFQYAGAQGGGAQVLNRDDPASLAMAVPGRRIYTFGLDAPRGSDDFGLIRDGGELWLAQGASALMAVRELCMAGLHNAANALAALALCRAIGVHGPALLPALREFRSLPHRVELVGERGGVRFYDDSKGTNVGSTVAALAGLAAPDVGEGDRAKVVLIAGGDGKGQDFSPLHAAVGQSARAVVLIGRDAALIARAIAGSGVTIENACSMEEAVRIARVLACPGDAVLLSPACASFDMFDNYKHRAEVFRAAVEALSHA